MPRARDIQFRTGTASQWAAANPVLDAGEPGFEGDTGKLKIGDGVSTWSALAYVSSGGGTSLTIATTEPKAAGVATPGATGQVSDAGHVHPRLFPSAGTFDGYKAWTQDYLIAATNTVTLAGANGVSVCGMIVEADTTLSTLYMAVNSAGTITTAGQCFAAIFDASGNRLAVSADISSQLTTTGKKAFPMTAATSAITAGTIVYGALLVNGVGTAPGFARCVTTTTLMTASRFGSVAGSGSATSMPSSFVVGSLGVGFTLWMAVA